MMSEPKLQDPAPLGRRPLLDPAAVSALLNVAVQTLASWRVKGCGPQFISMGRKILYDPAAVDAFIEANRRNSTSDRHRFLRRTPRGASRIPAVHDRNDS